MKIKRTILAIAVLSVLVICLSGALAVIMFTWDIDNSMTVSADFTLIVYEVDGVTECTAINWGDIGEGASVLTELKIKNVGNMVSELGYSVTALDPSFTLTVELFHGGMWKTWTTNKLPINPDEVLDAKFTLENVGVGAGSYSFGLHIESSDS